MKSSNALREISFHHVESRWSHDYFTNFTLYIQNNSVYLDMYLTRILQPGIKSHIDFQIRLKGSKTYQTLFSYTLDICNIVVNFKDTIFKKWFRSLVKYGNFMQNCPVFADHYYLNGWKLEPDLVPGYLYAGDYRVRGYGFYGKYKNKDEEFVVNVELDLSVT